MLEDDNTPGSTEQPEAAAEQPARKTPAKKATKKTAAKRTSTRKTATSKVAAAEPTPGPEEGALPGEPTEAAPAKKAAAKKAAAKKAPARKTTAKKPAAKQTTTKQAAGDETAPAPGAGADQAGPGAAPLFQAPDASQAPTRSRKKAAPEPDRAPEQPSTESSEEPEQKPARRSKDSGESPGADTGSEGEAADEGGEGGNRRRRRRGGRRRRKSGGEGESAAETGEKQPAEDEQQSAPEGGEQEGDGESTSSRRRRRRRRSGDDGGDAGDDPQNTVTKVRKGRTAEDQITAVTGSTRLEAKKQRRREGREAGRRRAPIVSEAEFLARRESVDRVMAIRQRDDLTQIAVLEDKVLVEHYVARESQTSLIGNVYLGRVQNVLPSMEAAFIDIGKGRNAVLYAGEVNWSALGHKEGQPRKIESVLSSGQSVLVQVTKDPVDHKGARLTSQISLAGRFLVYVPDGTNSGISRKLPDTERNRLKSLLKEIVPEGAGVIVRTAAEGAREEELTRDVERLTARWADIEKKAKGSAPQLLYGEPDLMLKVVRDLFTEDFSKLVVQGDDAWDTVQGYVTHVAPDLEERLERYDADVDLFATYRIDEQIHKGLDRKVWLPSGGSLIIDRTEAMTVVDVNTGKFTGSGGNLEETVTKNNLEAAEEIVRQLRLRDIGGIIVVDFIDMVLESNRDLVLRRLVECLGRDRTRHQVAEVTSLGLVQMTRKRIGTGLLEAFSETCEHCNGRGVIVADAPVEPKKPADDSGRRGGSRRSRRGRGGGDSADGQGGNGNGSARSGPSPKDVAAMARQAAKRDGEEAAREESSDRPEAEPAAAEAGATEPIPAEPSAAESTPAEPSAAEPSAAEPTPAEPTEEPATPAEPVAPVEPAAPKVVTRTRRRSASRPAGPPPAAATADTEPDEAPASTGTTGDTSAPEPVAPPPAWTAGGIGSIGVPPEDGNVEPGTAAAEPAPPTVEHVPVKKRGSRKR